jgi:hypothetical protein
MSAQKFYITFLISVIPRLDRGIQILRQSQDDWIGASPALNAGVKPENDNHNNCICHE